MILKEILFTLSVSLLFIGCSSDATSNKESTPDPVVVEEIQQLDSLNTNLEKNTKDIEESILSVEKAVSELLQN